MSEKKDNKSLIKVCKKALIDNLGWKEGESILIVTDSIKRSIGQAFLDAGLELTENILYAEFPPLKVNGEEPPEAISELMKKYNVVVCPLSKSITHTKARLEACKSGSKVATLPGISEEILKRCLSADTNYIIELSEKVNKILTKAKSIRITSKLGTDITLFKKDRRVISSTGVLNKNGDGGNLPSGEVHLAPEEGIGDGVIIFDGSIASIGKLDKPVEIEIKNGKAVSFKGGNNAKKLEEMLSKAGERAFEIAEFGIGTNPKAKVIGQILEDEKAIGTIHIAFGNNSSMGGSNNIGIHIDGLVMKPDVYADKIQIMKNGKFLI